MDIEIKYKVGDVVYAGRTHQVTKRHSCPDCNDTKAWKAVSPAGVEYVFGCPRCCASYSARHELSLQYSEYAPVVERLTIGSVRLDTNDEKPVSYMCVETGVGSGTIHYQESLFLTEAEAREHAEANAKAQTVATEWMAERYAQVLSVCDYELSNALIRKAKEVEWKACSAVEAARIEREALLDEIDCCLTMLDVKVLLERERAKDTEQAA